MRGLLAFAAVALLSSGRAEPVGAQAQSALPGTGPSTSSRRTEEKHETPDQVARRYGLAGELLIARGDKVLLDEGYGPIAPGGGARHRAGARWRLASITKQVTAARVVGAAAAGRFALDDPLDEVLAAPTLAQLSTRQLLTHHSGLADPDATTEVAGVPSFYRASAPDLTYCLSKPATPGSAFHYDNCDYVVAGLLLESRLGYGGAWPAGLRMARAGEIGVPGFIGGRPEPTFALASWGAAGGLTGTARALWRFDRELMTGRFMPPDARETLWTPEGKGSYQALGQWVFPGTLKGCTAPKRIVQRDGEIGGVQARNYILPDDDLVVIVFTNRGSDDFPIGEIWQGKSFAYDLLSAAACGKDAS